MGQQTKRDAAGDKITRLVLEVFLLNGRILRSGDALTSEFGLTSARWQVLAALGHGPSTVAQIARQRELRRQSVQETVSRLRADELAEARPNPRDQRAPLIFLTDKGRAALHAIQPAQARWANEVGRDIPLDQLQNTIDLLAKLCDRIDELPNADRPANP